MLHRLLLFAVVAPLTTLALYPFLARSGMGNVGKEYLYQQIIQ